MHDLLRGELGMYSNYRKLGLSCLIFGLLVAFPAEAYIDPGTTGLVTQLMYVFFYGLLAAFLVCIRYIKQILLKPKKLFAKLFGGVKD